MATADIIFENKAIKLEKSPAEALLNERELEIMDVLQRANGRILQNSLISKTGMTGPTISRTLLSLENKGFIVRKRLGMTNEILMVKR
ncbi:winged helix-turn-helix transcriptional regulator [Oxyplasma meridianum]|uniref:Winged helix-turn-helix transcriptional regulator n=1 Tax=Oxyplasma meridianum TaxID=3073602 RepID=A0AAX4NGJ2_9ARCH